MLPVTDAGQLGDLGVLNFKMPDNRFLYVYVSNESSQSVDFDNLSIIHKGGQYLEENHYYPYGILIEGLSYHSRINRSESKFNGDWYLKILLDVVDYMKVQLTDNTTITNGMNTMVHHRK